MINASVGNWTHHHRLARTEVRAHRRRLDARKVQALLLDPGAQPVVLKNPRPFVALVDISKNVGLEFELRLFLADVYDSGTVRRPRFSHPQRSSARIAISCGALGHYRPRPPRGRPAEPRPDGGRLEDRAAAVIPFRSFG